MCQGYFSRALLIFSVIFHYILESCFRQLKLFQAEGRHFLRKNKNRNLCQVGTLYQSEEFMPQVIRHFVYFVFMFIKLIFILKCTGPIC